MRGNVPLGEGAEGQEKYSFNEVPNILELDRVARRATRVSEKENVILHDRERPNVIHAVEGNKMGESKKFEIPLDEFDGVGNAKGEKSNGCDLWTDLSSLKADIIFWTMRSHICLGKLSRKVGRLLGGLRR